MAKIDFSWLCDSSLPDHPKVTRLSDVLAVSNTEALGIIVALFCRVRRFCVTGDVTDLSAGVIAAWTRNDHVTMDVLRQIGLVDERNGRLVIHGWSARKYAEMDKLREAKRKVNAQRVSRWRARQVREATEATGNGSCNTQCNTQCNASCNASVTPLLQRCNALDGDGEYKAPTELTDCPNNGQSVNDLPPLRGRSPKTPNPDVASAIRLYAEAHEKRTGRRPIIAGGKIGALAKRVLGAGRIPGPATLADIERLLPIYFDRYPEPSPDHFFASATLNRLLAGETVALDPATVAINRALRAKGIEP